MQNWQLTPAQNIGQPMHQQLKSARREGGMVTAITHLGWHCMVTIYLKVFHRLEIEGRENLPAHGPFVLVSNHASHLDSLVIASIVPWRLQSRVFPVAAGDTFFSTRIAGTFSATVLNALPMWRNRSCAHGLADLRDRLMQEKCIYIVFPEGTRTRTGTMGPFHAGIGMLVAGNAVPVIPCFVTGTFRAMPAHRRFPKPAKVRLRIGQSITFQESPNERDGWEHVAKAAETAVMAMDEKKNQ